jgi:hypothetical protein
VRKITKGFIYLTPQTPPDSLKAPEYDCCLPDVSAAALGAHGRRGVKYIILI